MNKTLMKAGKILILSHRKPDGDTLGSALALKIYLNKLGKLVTLACIDKPAKVFSFLPFIEDFVTDFDLNDFDLVIVVDAGASYMTGFQNKYQDIFSSGIFVINIDHHASNDNYGTLNIVDADAASTTLILYRYFKSFGINIDNNMAQCLIAGLYGDTGSFMHSNTDGEVYKACGDLLDRGADVGCIARELFKTRSVKALRLWGKVLEKSFLSPSGVVMSVIKEEDFRKDDLSPEELTGVIDYLSMVPDTRYAALISEDRQGNVKGSFRTRVEDVDLERIAKVFGGGGHKKASGFVVPGKLIEEVRYNISTDDGEKSLDFS
ncbi:bifunctional oligoribonuclease/PAP phosphatase NrnA [Patescibacteria group bacterium]|nr:bifunctional oligoribonuclease/PAP phosphatase NrnA [Patescibacteria group bacterium]